MDELKIETQKYHYGDIVKVAADLGPSMAHFRAGVEAIVLYSYRDHYGGSDPRNLHDYGLLFTDDGHESSWYHEDQLTLVRHGDFTDIERVRAEREARDTVQGDLKWIVENWAKLWVAGSIPSATISTLMTRIGITNPWGARGEGITFYSNALATVKLLDPVLSTGDLEKVEAFLTDAALPGIRPGTTKAADLAFLQRVDEIVGPKPDKNDPVAEAHHSLDREFVEKVVKLSEEKPCDSSQDSQPISS